jgi:hypothetical protein
MNKYAVFSKPLQFFNLLNIAEVDDSTILLMTNTFSGAKEFYNRLNKFSNFQTLFFESSKELYLWLKNHAKKGDKLFINTDYGLIQTLWLYPLRNLDIYVYEEGNGTYRTDLNQRIFPIRILLSMFDFKPYFGGGRFTKGIYVYDKSKYLSSKKNFKKEVLPFDKSFLSHLNNFPYKGLLYNDAFDLKSVQGREVVIYLSSWVPEPRIELYLSQYSSSIKLLKLHPHISTDNEEISKLFDVTIPAGVMVEFLLADLLMIAAKLIVIHHMSSSVEYLRNDPNFRELVLQ